MFAKSKKRRNLFKRVKSVLWPDQGIWRSMRYNFLLIIRRKASDFELSSGLACGVAVSFTPFIGFHFILAACLAFVLRSNVFAALAGTAFGNPFTFPFIYFLTYETGSFLLGSGKGVNPGAHALTFSSGIWRNIFGALTDPMSSPFIKNVFIPALAGSVPWMVLSWLVAFGAFFVLIRSARGAVLRRRALKQARRNDTGK